MSEGSTKSDLADGNYKDVRVGPKQVTVPKNWEVAQLGEVAEMHKGRSPMPKSDDSLFDGDIGWVKIKEISENNKLITETEETVTKKGAEKSRMFPEGTLVVGIYGASRGGVSLLGMEACSHEGVVGIFDLKDNVDLDYLYYCLLNENLNEMGHGAAQKNLTIGILESVDLLLPPLPEQRRIATILSTVDKQIKQTDDIIEEANELKRGLMQDVLIKGLSGDSTQGVHIGPRTVHIPDHWDMKPCGQLFEAVNGRGFKKEEWENEGTQIIRIQDLRPDAEAETNYADFEVDDKYHVKDGDLLFCWAGNIKTSLGAYIWSGEDAYLNQHIYNLRPKQELNKRFFKFSLNQHLTLLKTMVGGSAGQVHITKSDFESFELPFPPVNEQEKIGNIVEKTQQKIKQEEKTKEKMQELKRGLMQDLLTGKVRVDAD